MAVRIIYLQHGTRTKGKAYYLFDKYSTKEEAMKVAKHYKKKSKCRTYIQEVQAEGLLGWLVPHKMYYLYMDKVIALW